MAINQLLLNSITFADTPYFNKLTDNSITEDNYEFYKYYFDYITFIIIENGYDNILPNQLKKLSEIPVILDKVNTSRTNVIITLVCIFITIMISLCVLCSFLIIITNKSMSDGMEKVSKIKLEKIEEIIKRIKLFNTYLNLFREKEHKNEKDDDNKEEMRNLEGSVIIQPEKTKKKEEIVNSSNNINNLGFNMDPKKYLPLTKLKFSFLYTFVIFVVLIICVILILYHTLTMVKNTNRLLLVQNYIFGKLVHASISTIEIKCFMSYCLNKTSLNFTLLDDPNLISDVIKGANKFPKINEFYNDKFSLNACGAIYENENDEKYLECMNDILIASANNTDNILKLINDWVDNIHKEDNMNNDDRRNLFNTTYFKQIEYMFFKFIINVNDVFQNVVKKELKHYLQYKKYDLYIIEIFMGVLTMIFCFVFGFFFINKLVHHLSVSRIILKIIPTSVIISTHELETWIENKY
jgi:hypothetical protein